MTPRNPSLILILTLGLLGATGSSRAASEEIRVSLFGQPCTMTGPFPKSVLQNIHEISPEKLPPEMTVEMMKKIRNRTNEVQRVHSQIETYRDHLRKRLSARIAWKEAMKETRRREKPAQKLEIVLSNVREHITPSAISVFEKEMRAQLERSGNVWNDAFLATFRERYEALIQPDTEEEFHKAIRAAKIQYVCVFDDGAEDEDETETSTAETTKLDPSASPSPSASGAVQPASRPAPFPRR